MGRGKDKIIKSSDFQNMSPTDQQAVNNIIRNRGILGKVRVEGAAVVRTHGGGKVRYGEGATPGKYHEDKL
jgi:hypothetical protein